VWRVAVCFYSPPAPQGRRWGPQKILRFSGAGRPSPPPIWERGTSRWASSRTAPLRPVSFPSSPISLAAALPCASTSRIGGKAGIGGEQDRLTMLTGSRAVRALKLKISRLRLEMTGVHLTFGSKGQSHHRLFKAHAFPSVRMKREDLSASLRGDMGRRHPSPPHRSIKPNPGVPRKQQDFPEQGAPS